MAKTITDAQLVIRSGLDPSSYVECRVLMPISEYADFIALGDLTDAVPTAVTTWIAARNTAGTSSGA